MTDLKQLRALCDAATPGEWAYEYKKLPKSEMYSGQVFDESGENIAQLSWHPIKTSTGVKTDREENGKFIAATDPQTVRALIDEVERYRSILERLVLEHDRALSRMHTAKSIYLDASMFSYCAEQAQQALKGTDDE